METPRVLRALSRAHRPLGELKGLVQSIPNPSILISTLGLQEAKDSSEVENIVTTHDDLFQAPSDLRGLTGARKEVVRYTDGLNLGHRAVRETGLLTCRTIIDIHSALSGADIGFRRAPGTTLKEDATGEVIHVPPQHPDTVLDLMSNLERFINQPEPDELDPLTRMAIAHHQFETIHPFPDGNGRTGRIINVLMLVQAGLLDLPVLYLSRYITSTKSDYYALLQQVRDDGDWEPWLLYVLDGIAQTARHAVGFVSDIRDLMRETKQHIRTERPKIYSQDLLNNIFRHPYTRIGFVETDLKCSPVTASKYLETLEELGVLRSFKVGRDKYFVNERLVRLLTGIPPIGAETIPVGFVNARIPQG